MNTNLNMKSNSKPKFDIDNALLPDVTDILRMKMSVNASHESAELFPSTNIDKIEITIAIISNNRFSSLQRLMMSLSALHIPDRFKVNLKFSLESTSSNELVEYVYGFSWRHGHKSIIRRIQPGGLIRAVSESWFPASNNEYGLFLEDDIEVSPYALIWVEKILLKLYNTKAYDKARRIIGISLYKPTVTETNRSEMKRKPFHIQNITAVLTTSTEINRPFLFQTPCSWGALYFPDAWKRFLMYLRERLNEEKTLYIPHSYTNDWYVSWKKYLFEFMYIKGYFLVYPNFGNSQSLSTNHLEKGTHIKTESITYLEEKRIFTVPLVDNLSVFDGLDRYDINEYILIDLFGYPFLDKATMSGAFAAYSSPELYNTNKRVKSPSIFFYYYQHLKPESSEIKVRFTILNCYL